jgi:hypothetical protein
MVADAVSLVIKDAKGGVHWRRDQEVLYDSCYRASEDGQWKANCYIYKLARVPGAHIFWDIQDIAKLLGAREHWVKDSWPRWEQACDTLKIPRNHYQRSSKSEVCQEAIGYHVFSPSGLVSSDARFRISKGGWRV